MAINFLCLPALRQSQFIVWHALLEGFSGPFCPEMCLGQSNPVCPGVGRGAELEECSVLLTLPRQWAKSGNWMMLMKSAHPRIRFKKNF